MVDIFNTKAGVNMGSRIKYVRIAECNIGVVRKIVTTDLILATGNSDTDTF